MSTTKTTKKVENKQKTKSEILSIERKFSIEKTKKNVTMNDGYNYVLNAHPIEIADAIAKLAIELDKMESEKSGELFICLITKYYNENKKK